MQIDLRKVPTYWATIEKNKDRHERMISMYSALGFENTNQINGPLANPYTIGIAETHIEALGNKLPLLVMEDDCAVTEHWRPLIEVPDDADAIYLGTSWYGMVRGASQFRGCISSSYSEDLIRPYNMLGIHSVLYLSEEYRQKVVGLLTEFKKDPGSAGCDECIASNMKNYNVYATKNPMFYQADGHSDAETITPLQTYF